jgi:hypothetical protein
MVDRGNVNGNGTSSWSARGVERKIHSSVVNSNGNIGGEGDTTTTTATINQTMERTATGKATINQTMERHGVMDRHGQKLRQWEWHGAAPWSTATK